MSKGHAIVIDLETDLYALKAVVFEQAGDALLINRLERLRDTAQEAIAALKTEKSPNSGDIDSQIV